MINKKPERRFVEDDIITREDIRKMDDCVCTYGIHSNKEIDCECKCHEDENEI